MERCPVCGELTLGSLRRRWFSGSDSFPCPRCRARLTLLRHRPSQPSKTRQNLLLFCFLPAFIVSLVTVPGVIASLVPGHSMFVFYLCMLLVGSPVLALEGIARARANFVVVAENRRNQGSLATSLRDSEFRVFAAKCVLVWDPRCSRGGRRIPAAQANVQSARQYPSTLRTSACSKRDFRCACNDRSRPP